MPTSGKTSPPSVRENVRWGVRWGLYGALFFTGLAAVPALLRTLLPAELVDGRLPSLPVLVGVYIIGGLTGGVIVGLVRPWMRWWIARRLAGIVVAIPISFAVSYAISGAVTDVRTTLEFAGIWGFVMSFVVEEDPLAPFRRWNRRR